MEGYDSDLRQPEQDDTYNLAQPSPLKFVPSITTDSAIPRRPSVADELTARSPRLPTYKEKLNEKGMVLLRIAAEFRGFIDLTVDDPDAKSLLRDIETLEEIGRWLSSASPISSSAISSV